MTPQPPLTAERVMGRANQRLAQRFLAELDSALLQMFKSQPKAIHTDAKLDQIIPDGDIDSIVQTILGRLAPGSPDGIPWESWEGDMVLGSVSIGRKVERDLGGLGMPPGATPASAPILEAGIQAQQLRLTAHLTNRANNLAKWMTKGRLAESGGEGASVVSALMNAGLHPETVSEYIQTVSSEARATMSAELAANGKFRRVGGIAKESRLVAVDQVLTTNAEISQMKLTSIGVTEYEWVTQRDERVRDWHADLDSTVQNYQDPPMGGGTGPDDIGNPGTGINCRCGAFPIL